MFFKAFQVVYICVSHTQSKHAVMCRETTHGGHIEPINLFSPVICPAKGSLSKYIKFGEFISHANDTLGAPGYTAARGKQGAIK